MSPAQELNPTQRRFVEKIFAEIAQKLQKGQSRYRIEQSLVERGLKVDIARDLVNQILDEKSRAHRDAATRQMALGTMFCLIGIALSWAIYSTTSSAGAYAIAWLAILFGGWRFLGGINMLSSYTG